MIGLALALACGTSEPQTLASCNQQTDPTAREDCRLTHATRLVGDQAAFNAATAGLDDTAYDLLIARLAFNEPSHAGWLCKTVRTDQGRTRCKRITGRPHLGGSR